MPVVRSFPPIEGPRARVLLLGSMPGVRSLAAGEYYAHPRNAFWPIMGALFGADPKRSYAQRCAVLRRAGVAVWDVLQECQRDGSLDAAITRGSEQANNLAALFDRQPTLTTVGFNGGKAEEAFHRTVLSTLPVETVERLTLVRLPSTSPAHASLSYDEKLAVWRAALGGK
ncbi:DNA-deoxyinosine glycosylase [Botrimarina hoheduenensis]|uniref:Uracil DNA glycosylase superfamily protein n=1 Tax=Botrimarina hoheduenensis TaxID=2528000 RepID=A0A5C5W8K4_9BACT|nr:DNA-deoxyinosine glycosylase [Botrimarina hoheduenensis]TWT46515.1 Uracil DNA glycosylase superfamily protein [Botrimarina hoheduenensis]